MTRKTRHSSFFSGWFALGWTKITAALFEVACLSMCVKMCVFICKKLWWKVDFQIETLWHSKIIRFAEQSTRIYLRYLSYLYIRAVVCSTRPKTAWTLNFVFWFAYNSTHYSFNHYLVHSLFGWEPGQLVFINKKGG